MPLGQEDVDFLIRRSGKLKENRQLYEPLWEEIAQYIIPGRVGIGYKPTPGAKQTTQIYDSSAIFSNDQLAASMCGTITPSSMIWAYLKLADDRLNHIKPIMDWLEQCSTLQHFTRKRSNFYAEIPEVYSDLGSFGEGCVLVEENPITTIGFNGFYYKALANSEYCTAENHQGFVDTVFREFELSLRAVVEKWPNDIDQKIKDRAEKDPEDKLSILHCVFPKEGKNHLPFVSYYINLQDKKLITEGGYHELPYIVPRWRKTSGEDYGRGQGHIALPDTKTVNKAKEFGLRAWAKDLDPATFEKDGGVIGKLKLYPGGRNVVRDKDSVWVMDHKIKYDVSQIKEEELRTSIKQIFFSDQLNLPDKGEMREAEVLVRYELMQRLLGPAVGRIEIELLKCLVEREFGIMMRARFLPPPPPILARMGIKEIDIEYEGPLARMQRAKEVEATQKLFKFTAEIASLVPDSQAMDNLDIDAGVRFEGEAVGAPSKVMRSEEEVKAIREARARRLAAEKQKQDLERLAGGIGQVTPAIKAIGELGKGEEGATKTVP